MFNDIKFNYISDMITLEPFSSWFSHRQSGPRFTRIPVVTRVGVLLFGIQARVGSSKSHEILDDTIEDVFSVIIMPKVLTSTAIE